jgi:nicotinamidase-related amidase
VGEAVLVLDTTRDSIAPEARAVEKRRAILPRAVGYLAWARGRGMPVVFVWSARRRTDRWFLEHWELANEIWTSGQAPIPELYQPGEDTVVHERRYIAFFRSDLELTLHELGVAHAWGGHSVEETQQWPLDFIAAMAESRIATSNELMG